MSRLTKALPQFGHALRLLLHGSSPSKVPESDCQPATVDQEIDRTDQNLVIEEPGDTQSVYFFSHHKCATGWLSNVLVEISNELKISLYNTSQSDDYLFDSAIFNNVNASYPLLPSEFEKGIHVVRDVRDLVVSAYYSHLHSHPTDNWPELQAHRKLLERLPKDAGMIAEIGFLESVFHEGHACSPLQAMLDWNYEDPRIMNIRMEDMVREPYRVIIQSLRFLDLPCPQNLAEILGNFTFEKISGGRKPGDLDKNSHYRSGVAGDWKTELPEAASLYLTEKYSPMLKQMGYSVDQALSRDVA
ncbi:MAG: hypothetical protein COA78_19570 [Blastopirellula sp.]|nr:MAG: hypothetical protein COA78_19570 [Blastopirellula sp.]